MDAGAAAGAAGSARAPSCDGRLDDADGIELFEVSVELAGGRFCGREPRAELCPDGVSGSGPAACRVIDDTSRTELPGGFGRTGPAAPSCPASYDPVPPGECPVDGAWCFRYSESLACHLRVLTHQECTEAGGTPRGDPGDGSLMNAGCPAGSTAIALLEGYIEGGLCCVTR